MTERRETAGLTIRLIIDYVRRSLGETAVIALLERAGESRPLSVLEDERVWSTYDQKISLFAAAAEVTGSDDVARVIGETVFESPSAPPCRWRSGSWALPRWCFGP